MKFVDFLIADDCIALERGNAYFDLHNNFDFHGLVYNPTRRTLELHWLRSSGAWVAPTDPSELRVLFSSVYLFRASERESSIRFTEDDCLDTIGFVPAESLDMECHPLLPSAQAGSHLMATFMSGFVIKIGAESAVLVEGDAAVESTDYLRQSSASSPIEISGMQCFVHEDAPAVGACKVCVRAVCRSCARVATFALTCSDACEREAAELHEMNVRAKRIYGIGDTKRVFPLAVLMWGLFALMFGGFGFFNWIVLDRTDWFLLVFGGVCAFLAVISYRRTKSLQLNC